MRNERDLGYRSGICPFTAARSTSIGGLSLRSASQLSSWSLPLARRPSADVCFSLGSFLFQALFWSGSGAILSKQPGLLVDSGRSAYFSAGFLNPGPWMLSMPRIYEAAIAAGQFFLMAGLFFVLMALDRPFPSKCLSWTGSHLLDLCRGFAGNAGTTGCICLASWLCSGSFRANAGALRPGSECLVLSRRSSSNFVRGCSRGLVQLGPLRLDLRIRLPLCHHDASIRTKIMICSSCLYISRPNVTLYLFAPPAWDTLFPFVRPLWPQDLVSSFNEHFHLIYNSERIIGLAFSSPFLLFALLPSALELSDSLRHRQSQRDDITCKVFRCRSTSPLAGLLRCLPLHCSNCSWSSLSSMGPCDT